MDRHTETPSVRAYASIRSSKPRPRAPIPDPRLKPGPVFVASGCNDAQYKMYPPGYT